MQEQRQRQVDSIIFVIILYSNQTASFMQEWQITNFLCNWQLLFALFQLTTFVSAIAVFLPNPIKLFCIYYWSWYFWYVMFHIWYHWTIPMKIVKLSQAVIFVATLSPRRKSSLSIWLHKLSSNYLENNCHAPLQLSWAVFKFDRHTRSRHIKIYQKQ